MSNKPLWWSRNTDKVRITKRDVGIITVTNYTDFFMCEKALCTATKTVIYAKSSVSYSKKSIKNHHIQSVHI